MFTFIKLPHRLFIPKEEEESYIKIIKDDKVVFVLDYLLNNVSKARDKVNFTLEDMITKCGYKPSQKENGNNGRFKNILKGLLDLKIIEYDFDSENMKSKQMYSITLKLIMENDFIQLFDAEKETILSSTIKDINNRRLFIYYGYLKSRMYRRKKNEDLGKTGGRPEVCFPSFKTITFDLGLNDKIINKYNEALIELNFIRIANAGHFYYIDDKTKMQRESCNIYTMYNAEFEETWKENLKEGIKYYKSLKVNKSKVFTNNTTYKNNNRKLNGELGSIIKKEKLGTATEKDISRKNEIMMSASDKADSIFQIKGLLSNNEGKILSDIFADVYSDKLADKWFDTEVGLGLVKDNSNDLLVDYNYYKWVVMNYDKSDHDYYVNCVKKHIAENKKPKHKGLFGELGKKKIEETTHDCDPYNLNEEPKEPNTDFMYEGDNEELCDENDYPDDDQNEYNEMM
ncbi:hypothetical protein [Clostridium estertheticum]|uniref:hypothetical protein n=1 Tax=Clostridium estertheticum TaxID=238834 RepID=UPI001CF596ED|nr:hypothetical protein [Clostridium estertheticum]MCB2354359.1 hypothetical protein [Clostridium estertheticum]WAG42522.1 hypothetical protein LL065_07570 [Clostridium estertheticum]